MTIRTAKENTEMLNSLLLTFSGIIKPYCITAEQEIVMENFRIEMLAIADAEISFSENMTRMQEGLTWDEYHEKYSEKKHNHNLSSEPEGNKNSGKGSWDSESSETGSSERIVFWGIKGIYGTRSGRD